jgi:uncharacterized RDD family membrane protein YckC
MRVRIKFDQNTRYAGFWRRVGASVIDTLLLVPLLAIIMYLLHGPAYFNWPINEQNGTFDVYDGLNDLLIQQLLPIFTTLFFWIRFLGTPGKLLLGCHIVNAQTGAPLSIGHAVLRYLGYFVSTITFMLGFLWVAWDKRKQGFHDKIANSVVVIHDESTATVEELQTEFGRDIS